MEFVNKVNKQEIRIETYSYVPNTHFYSTLNKIVILQLQY